MNDKQVIDSRCAGWRRWFDRDPLAALEWMLADPKPMYTYVPDNPMEIVDDNE